MANIYGDLRNLFFNSRFSDLDIICQDGTRFKAHCIVISLHSPVLNSMITEALDDQGRTFKKIELPDVDFNTLYMVLQFLYGGNYNDYETVGSFHSPSYVVFMTLADIRANLKTLPCLHVDLPAEETSVDGDYDDERASDSAENGSEDEEADADSPDGDINSEPDRNQEPEVREDTDRDDRRVRIFYGHSLFDSLSVYSAASRYGIAPLKLLARDRFYRTAEKVLLFPPSPRTGKDAILWAHGHQCVYQAKLIEAVFNDFPRVIDELYRTIPESDVMMRAIPPMLIATGYHNDVFRDHMKPLLEKYPDLALAVVECMRMPQSGD